MSNSKRSSKYVKLAKKLGADAKTIQASNIFLDNRSLLKCEVCDRYGRHWLCPPNIMKPWEFKEILKDYRHAVLVHGDDGKKLRDIMYRLESEAFVDGYYWAFAFFPKLGCEKCAYPMPCRHPRKDRPTAHSHGVDMYKTARKAGFKIYPLKSEDEKQHRFGLLLID